MRRPGLALSLGIVVAAVAWLATQYLDHALPPAGSPAPVAPIPVTWQDVTTTLVPDLVVRPGQVVATRFQLAPRVSGRLVDLPVRPGDRLPAGARLATLAAPELEHAVQRAEAELSAARADLADAEADVARLAVLAKTQATSEDALRKGQVRKERAAAAVAAAQATLASRREDLAELAVRAPEPLIALRRLREPGDLAGPTQPILEAEVAEGRRFEAWVPLQEAQRLAPGMAVVLRIDGAATPISAELTRIVDSADAITRTRKIEVTVPHTVDVLAGAFGEVTVRLGDAPVTAVPEAAVVERAGVTGAFLLVAPDVVRYRSVRTGRRFEDQSEVLAGLRRGDRVVLNPPPTLRDGARVKPPSP
jgi:RND family efflux transporter MFP subunit